METIAYVLVGLAAFVVLFLIGRRLWFGGEESFEEEEDDEGAADEGSEADDDEGSEADAGADDEGGESDSEGLSDGEGGESDSDADEGSEAGESDSEGADAPLMAADLAMPQIVAMPPAAPAPDARAFDDLDLDTEWKWRWQYAADDVDDAKLRKTAWLKPYIDNRDIKPFDLGFDQMKENEDVSGKGNGKLTDLGADAGAGDLGAMDDMAGAMPPFPPPLPPMDGDEALAPMAASPPPTMGSAAGFGSDLE